MVDRQPNRFQRHRARQKAVDEERRRGLVNVREEVKRLKEFETYMKKIHPELVVAYEMERRLEQDDYDTLGMDEVDDLLQVFE